ncbi:MAG: type II secretion system GspH family protein [Gammaproteobacteria bacterium]|nr:type II secretion system GspH family protein [Gammaproteobacteria bacterium]
MGSRGQKFSARKAKAGFTLVELVVVMIIVGVLATVSVPKFFSTAAFSERGFTAEVMTVIRFAQNLSSTTGCDIRMVTLGNEIVLQHWNSCIPADHASGPYQAVKHPSGGQAYRKAAPSGLALPTVDVYFDNLGKPYDSSTSGLLTTPLDLNIGSRTIRIEPHSGFSHVL